MSADNHIVIEEGEDKVFRGYDRFIEGDYSELSDYDKIPIFEAASIRKAVDAAEKYMTENIVEYGYTFFFLPSEEEETPFESDASKIDRRTGQIIFEEASYVAEKKIPISLEPGKIYCLSIKNAALGNLEDLDLQLEELKKKHNISFLILIEGVEIVSVPKGYKIEIVKETGDDKCN